MKEKSVFQNIKKIFGPPEGMPAEEFRLVRPFYLMVMIMLGFVYFVSVSNQRDLQTIGGLSAFTFLMVLHGILHWRSFVLVERPGWDVYYVFVQSVIALMIAFMVKELGLSFGVIAAMIGESFGILRKKRGLAFLTIGLLIIGMVGVTQISGLGIQSELIILSVPLVLFVVIYVELFSRQAEAREQAQGLLKELESAHQELTEYAAQVEELTLHSERERMAFELHDTLGQGVAGLVLQLEAVKNHLENGRAGRAEEIVEQAMQNARSTLADSRAVIDDLRQMKVGEVSFEGIIFQLSENFRKSNGIPVDVKTTQILNDLEIPIVVLEHLERIISEAFFNITRHAQAKKVSVEVSRNNNELILEIHDDGVGFDPEKTDKDGSYGLLGIQDRAERIGGSFEVHSRPKKGTTIKVVFPLTNNGVAG